MWCAAPEMLVHGGRYGYPADIWSLACVIWEMATTKHPFTQYTDRMVAMYNIAHAKTPPDPPDVLSVSGRQRPRIPFSESFGEWAIYVALLVV